jgi:regulatory protein SWI5
MTTNLPQPAVMQRAKSLQGVPGSTFTQTKAEMSSPPNTALFDVEPFDMSECRDNSRVPGSTFTQTKAEMPSPPNTALFDVEPFDMSECRDNSHESPEFQRISETKPFLSIINPGANFHSLSSASNSYCSSPELAAIPLPEDSHPRDLKIAIPPNDLDSTPASPSKTKLSPRIVSIDNLNLDSRIQASITETGITIEDIASYISGPDPEDRKWVCLHPGCNRRFGRKENIKSHVQTHLGDRQFKCDHCDKCFVRGHDLKRHAKIHTGDKPYECLCGNVFARHDALTRHRQRGMCIGGYKDVVRKPTKRGRPRKHRPDMEERQIKSSRTREKVATRSIAPSVSGSDISDDSPPTEVFENMSIGGSSPLESSPIFESTGYRLPPDFFTFTPPASPGYSTGNKPSPSRIYRSLTPLTDDETLIQSPSRRPLEQISEEFPDLPPISEAGGCFDPDTAILSSLDVLSSPNTIPTLTESSTGSDMDIFINQDSTSGFSRDELSSFSDAEIANFTEFGVGSSFGSELELFQSKGIPSLNDDFFLQFQAEEQTNDIFFKSFP